MNTVFFPSALLEVLILAFCVSLFVSVVIVVSKRYHGRLTLDSTGGVQKFHDSPTPRIGGVALMVGLVLAYGYIAWVHPFNFQGSRELLLTLGVAIVPTFVAGLMEDLTKRISPSVRLIATMLSGGLFCILSGYQIASVQMPLVDALLSWYGVALLFSAFSIAGVANSINIIDGFNGLAGGVSMLILLALAAIAHQAGDVVIVRLSLLGVALIAGFMCVNFPRGCLFLGDAGAYSIGFYIACLCVSLVNRNLGEVSPWAMLLLCGYPIIETLFSVYRRLSRKRRSSPGAPDASHLHSLVYRRLICRTLLPNARGWQRNAATSPFMWLYAAVPMLGALTWPDSLLMVAAWLLLSFSVYQRFYKRVLRGNWSAQRHRRVSQSG